MDKLLEVNDLNITYKNKNNNVYAVKHVDFTIYQGDSLGIVGESGSGKSTLAMGILRLLPERTTEISGSAMFKERWDLLRISQKEMDALRWVDLAVVFQKAMNALSPVHKIRTMVEDIYRVHEPEASSEEIREIMIHLLKLVNLSERVYDLYPHEMSGGMLQRVSIAMSLLHSPSLLIFDEATTALDVVTQGQILTEIVNMEKVLNTTRIMISHDMSVIASSCNKIAVMYAGEILEIGLVANVMVNPKHPYTQALLRSFPSLKGHNDKLTSIPGSLPDLSQKNDDCVFAPRCPYAGPRCRREKPRLSDVHEQEHWQVACFLNDGGVA